MDNEKFQIAWDDLCDRLAACHEHNRMLMDNLRSIEALLEWRRNDIDHLLAETRRIIADGRQTHGDHDAAV